VRFKSVGPKRAGKGEPSVSIAIANSKDCGSKDIASQFVESKCSVQILGFH